MQRASLGARELVQRTTTTVKHFQRPTPGYQRPEVQLFHRVKPKIHNPVNLARERSAQPVPASPRPPRAPRVDAKALPVVLTSAADASGGSAPGGALLAGPIEWHCAAKGCQAEVCRRPRWHRRASHRKPPRHPGCRPPASTSACVKAFLHRSLTPSTSSRRLLASQSSACQVSER